MNAIKICVINFLWCIVTSLPSSDKMYSNTVFPLP